jgi:iron complex outermembrane recepter protein
MKINSFKFARLTSAIKATLMASAGVALLSTTNAVAEESAQEEDNRIIITGSKIKRSQAEGPSPVVTITREDMEKQGYATLQDAMDSLVQNTGGSVDQSFTFGFVPGASSIDLRGFGNGRSLTLIDGKRLPVYPVANSGTDNFVDLSAIPASMIERVEILTDGASAIYGSDAVSGVINIITRKDIEGVEVSVRLGDTSDGGYENERVSFVAGATTGKTSVSVLAEYQHNEPLMASQRDYAASDTADPRGAYSAGGASFVAVGAGFASEIIAYDQCGNPNDELGSRLVDTGVAGDYCRYNRTQHRQLFPENDRAAISARIDHELTNDVSLYARAGFSSYQTQSQLEPNFYGGWWFGTQPGNNFATVANSSVGTVLSGVDFGTLADGSPDYMWGLVAAGSSNNPTTGTANEREGFFVRRLFEYGERRSNIKNDGVNALVGLEGVFGNAGYEWEASLGYNQTRLGITRPNIISSVFNNLVSEGLDLFQIIPQSVIDRSTYLSTRSSESNNVLFDFQISGELPFELAGGAPSFAVFGDFERQWFFNSADPITLAGDAFDGGSAGAGSREHSGIGFEINFPVLEVLDIDIAVRNDKYNDASDVGSALSPRIAMTYRPTDEILIRMSAGQSFRAPDLQRLFGATTNAFTTVNDPNFCQDPANPNTPQLASSSFCQSDPTAGVWQQQSIGVTTGSNVALEEEEGENFNIGAVWNVNDDLSVTLDYYNIKLENIVSQPSAQFMINQCNSTGTRFCDNVARNPQGLIAGVSATAQNLSLQEITGADLTIRYGLDTSNIGKFDFTAEFAWVDSLETQFDESSDVIENTGLASIPDLRTNLTADWNMDNWGATLRWTWTGEMCGVNGGGNPDGSCIDGGPDDEFIEDYAITNLSFRHNFGDAGRVSLGVNNVFNEDPAVDPTNNQWPWFFNNGGFSNPIGREYSVTYTYNF